jgi:hypothetical protein
MKHIYGRRGGRYRCAFTPDALPSGSLLPCWTRALSAGVEKKERT